MFRPFHETADPLKQPCLIRMAADALYLFYMGFDFYRFTKQLYFFSSLDNTAAQCAYRLISGKENGAFRSPEIMLQMVSDTSGITHACGRDNYLRLFVKVDGNGIVACNGETQAGEGNRVDALLNQGFCLVIITVHHVFLKDCRCFHRHRAVEVDREIVMALYKMNKFHWHLTDDQGWRIEIKKYPLLTEKGAWRKFNSHDRECIRQSKTDNNPDMAIPEDKIRIVEGDTLYGGYYTQEDIKDVIAYAKIRGIDIIPEIDMPGHMLAAVSNYEGVSCFNETGWGSVFSSPVCPGKDSALEFCKNIYAELIALFPYKYVHIGGDEVEKTNWKKCPDCQKRMHDNNLKTEEELQSWFIHDMERFFNGKGKEMIGWDEIIEGGLSKTATVMWWRSWVKDAATKATAQGNPVIFTPNGQFYLDYAEDKNSMASIYNLDTTDNLTPEQQSLILGVQGNIWCEWIPSNARMQYMAIPRLLAIAELGWSKPEQKDWNAFKQRLSDQFERLNIMGINYRIPDLEGFNAVNAFIGEGTINVTCLDPTAEIHYTTDGSTPTLQSPVYEGPIKVTETTDFTFCTFRPNGKKGDIAKTRFIKSEYTPSVTAAPSNPGLKATWHEFKGNKCSEIEKAPVNGTYPVEDVMIPKKVKGNIGLIIKGYFNAPQDDIYTFALLSDDGSTLTIDSEQIVDNDGPHGPKEIVGQKALAKGYHPMELRYFDQNGGQLKLKVTGSDGKEIPFTHLYAH